MTIQRDLHLRKLVDAKHNGVVKVITGLRRCGKSYLLFNLFRNHLLESGVAPDHIIAIDLEQSDDAILLNPITLRQHIQARIKNDGKWTYVLIDEIQNCGKVLLEGVDPTRLHPDDRDKAYVTFYKTLSALRTMPNVDVYVTGSNSRMLASDIATEFRGRSEVIALAPLNMSEFAALRGTARDLYSIFYEYLDFGGLPECVLKDTEEQKTGYLANLYRTIYLRDMSERYGLKNDLLLDTLVHVVMSNIGGLTNPTKLANAISTEMGIKTNNITIGKYLDHLTDAFMVARALRYDVKGRRYLNTPMKYYVADCGLRNAALNFRQAERPHLMENVLFNELVQRGYAVDVGAVEFNSRTPSGKHEAKMHEIDFVVNKASQRIYIQSAFAIPDERKRTQETFSLMHTGDSFRKIVVTGDPYEKPWTNESGITFIGIMPFLLDPKNLDTL